MIRQILVGVGAICASVSFAQQPANYSAGGTRNYTAGTNAYAAGTNSYAAYGYYSLNYKYRYPVADRFATLPIDPKYPVDYVPEGKKAIQDFLPEPRDIFKMMDQVFTERPLAGNANEVSRKLEPLDFTTPDSVYGSSATNQRAIYGRNTWMLWCGGNEDFWDWLAQDGYGVLDFLKALDSRKRDSRLRSMGLINQPGLKGTSKPGPWGLRLDTVERQIGVEGDYNPFKEGDGEYPAYKDDQRRELKSDGVDPAIYGYPSGVIGLRLFPNPNFSRSEEAKRWWNADAFYEDSAYAKDPRTVRPFLVGMSCVVCHIGPHPLNPPRDAEEPEWSNLSSILGNQYFRTATAFGAKVERANFLWQFLASQQPGTIDTSMVSSDQINNGNAMNAVFELPARLHRALLNPPEIQGPVAQTLPGEGQRDRKIARVLMDGADSIGVFGALARVYLNIGMYHDEWNRCSNPIIGFKKQRPFSIDACRRNSLYWRVNENFRVGYLMDFFLWEKRTDDGQKRIQCATAKMRLDDALIAPTAQGERPKRFVETDEGKKHWDNDAALKGSKVFGRHCMVCHSSKQPSNYQIDFALHPGGTERNWTNLPVNNEKLIMPLHWQDWEAFKKSPAYRNYIAQALPLIGDGDPAKLRDFLDNNYMSTDLRIPVSLTGTPAGRALASNALKGQVWEEFASETYRELPAVGEIEYYDPFSGTNKKFQPAGGGLGYYHVPSLVSIWATAPLLHNNALGLYLPDDQANQRVSVAGRLKMFDDAITKLLWKEKRRLSPSGEAGLRDPSPSSWTGSDPGWIFRTDVETEIRIPRGHIRRLIQGPLPDGPRTILFRILDLPGLLPLLLAILAALLAALTRKGYFYYLLLTGVLLLSILAVSGIHYLLPAITWLLPFSLIAGALLWIWNPRREAKDVQSSENQEEEPRISRALNFVDILIRWGGLTTHALVLIGLFAALWLGREFVNGRVGDLRFGPFPKGMPVNSLMNMNPDAPLLKQLAAVRGLLSTVGKLRDADRAGKHLTDAERLGIFKREAGPALMRVSKCPDFVLDRGHYFGQDLTDEEKNDLIAFLKTL